MKRLLERLKLIDYLTTEIAIERRVLVDRLTKSVDSGKTSFIFSSFEAFGSSKNEYKGIVTYDGFKIRKRRKLFDSGISLAVAEGTFRQKDDRVIVDSTITGFRRYFIFFLVVLLFFYLGSIISFFISYDNSSNALGWIVIPFVIVHAAFMLGIPYFIIRRGVSKMKYDLERDLYFLTREVNDR